MKSIEDIAYSGWKLNGGFEEFEKSLYFEKAVPFEALEEFMRYSVE